MPFIIFIVFIVGMYLLLLRPQQQRVRRQRELITAIDVGDQIVTAGGLIGRVVSLTDERLQLEVADGVQIELLRLAISRKLDEPGSDDSSFGDAEPDSDEELELDQFQVAARVRDDHEGDSPAPPAAPPPEPEAPPPEPEAPPPEPEAPPPSPAPEPEAPPPPPLPSPEPEAPPTSPAAVPEAPAPPSPPPPIPPAPMPPTPGQDPH